MAFRRRTFRRRAFRRSRRTFRKRRSFGRRKTFARRVKRVILRTLEPKKLDNIPIQEQTMTEGDGSTRIVYINNPANLIATGDNANQMDGDKFWLNGFTLRGSFHMDTTTPPATACLVRVSMIFSRQQMLQPTGNFVVFGSTTTLTTNPAQTAPWQNPQLFESTGAGAFVGDAFAIPFNRKNCKVLKSYTIPVNPSGDVEGTEFSMPTPFKLWFPVKRMMQFDNPLETAIAGNSPFKYGTYYIVIQVIASAAGTLTDTVVRANWRLSTHFRNI